MTAAAVGRRRLFLSCCGDGISMGIAAGNDMALRMTGLMALALCMSVGSLILNYFAALPELLRFFIQRTTTSASIPSASAAVTTSTSTNIWVMPLMPPP